MALELELKQELDGIKTALETKTTAEVKAAIDALETKFTAELKTQFETEIKSVKDALEAKLADAEAKLKSVQEHADKLDMKLQSNVPSTRKEDVLVKTITENYANISNVRKGNAVQTKVVGDMTLGANLTGDQPRDYNFSVVMTPGQAVNVSDLVGSVNISGGTYTFPREKGGEGSIGAQTEGQNKNQKDYDVEMVDVNTDFIAGYARYSKKMANNLPFLTSFVPNALRRDYMISENSAFNTVLATDATDSTSTASNKIELLIKDIAAQQDANYIVNGIVVRPSDYWDILITEKSTGAGYGLPGVVTVDASGQLRINGIPVYQATWVGENKYFLGDWTRVNKIITEGLSLEFSEQEGTNFVKNNITARIEAQVALAVEQPLALIYGDFTNVSEPSV